MAKFSRHDETDEYRPARSGGNAVLLVVLGVLGGLALLLVLGGVAAVFLFGRAESRPVMVAEPPADVADDPIAKVWEVPLPPPADKLPEQDAVARLLTDYHRTPFAERGKLVLDPETYAKANAAWYKNRPFFPDAEVTVNEVKEGPKDNYLTVAATGKTKQEANRLNYYVARTPEGLRIDWNATVGHNAVSMRAFETNPPAGPVEFRATCSLGTYFNYHYGSAEHSHYNVRMTENGTNNSLNGYVEKETDTGRQIFAALKDGQSHRLILEVHVTGPNTGHVGITKLVSRSWVR